MNLKIMFLAALLLSSSAHAFVPARCAPYGSKEAQHTWRLCPDGSVYERERRYWGTWHRIDTQGPCTWDGTSLTWQCKTKTIRCSPKQC